MHGKRIKTGMYYLRTQAATQAVQFTVEKQSSIEINPVIPSTEIISKHSTADNNVEPTQTDSPSCSMEDGCISCGS